MPTSEPIAVLYPTAPSTVTETFRLSDDITGLNFVGPFRSIVGARLAVRSEYIAAQSATPRDTAHVRGL